MHGNTSNCRKKIFVGGFSLSPTSAVQISGGELEICIYTKGEYGPLSDHLFVFEPLELNFKCNILYIQLYKLNFQYKNKVCFFMGI